MITMHPILRALINLSSSKNQIHLEYITRANICAQLETIILDAYLPKSCKANLVLFCVQIMGNIASNARFSPLVLESGRICEWLVDSLRDGASDRDLKAEICICLRNSMYHNDSKTIAYSLYLISRLIDNGVIPSIMSFIDDTNCEDKIQLAALDCILTLGKFPGTPKTTSDDAVRSGISEITAHHGFGRILDLLIKVSGQDLDQMDQDIDFRADSEEDDSDNEPVVPQISAFNLSASPSAGQQGVTEVRLKEKIGNKAKLVLITHFKNDLYSRIHEAHASNDVMRDFGMLSFTKGGNQTMLDLVKEFESMNPSPSKPTGIGHLDSAVELPRRE